MGHVAVREKLEKRALNLTPEQFEQLAKILIEEIERPQHIELTPFGSDGGIDIRGSTGTSFFEPKFGVQVKQYSSGNNIGKPTMQKFIGALAQHNYQYGCFITSSGYVTDIDAVAGDQPIVLIDGEKLYNVMMAHGLGVRQKNSSYKIDESFWNLFESADDEDKIPTILVPQADNLDIMHIALEAVKNGQRFKPEITSYMIENTEKDSWSQRQADYYPNSGLALGVLHKDTDGEYDGKGMQRWSLTRKGREYLELRQMGAEGKANRYLYDLLREMEIIRRALDELEEKGTYTHQYLKEIVERETKLTGTTVGRRRGTVGTWMAELPEVHRRSKGNRKVYEYISKRLDDYSSA